MNWRYTQHYHKGLIGCVKLTQIACIKLHISLSLSQIDPSCLSANLRNLTIAGCVVCSVTAAPSALKMKASIFSFVCARPSFESSKTLLTHKRVVGEKCLERPVTMYFEMYITVELVTVEQDLWFGGIREGAQTSFKCVMVLWTNQT